MKLLCNIPNVLDGTSLYRAMGPLSTLSRQGRVDLTVNVNSDWMALKGVDALFIQRPYLEAHLNAIKFAKMCKKKVWLDFDDNLFAVPLCNRRHLMYGYPEVHHCLASMIALADIVSVSTGALGEYLREIIKQFPNGHGFNTDPGKILVVSNAYDPEIHPSLEVKKADREKLIVWRGSASHDKDLWLHTEQLVDLAKNLDGWNIEFIGEPFWMTIEALQKVAPPQTVSVTSSMDPLKYFDYLDKIKPALVIVPLEDQAFNRSKSNVAWIEATAAGAVTLAPAWPEWTRPGIINYEGSLDLYRKIREFMLGDYNAADLWEKSKKCILTGYNLDNMNIARLEIMNRIKS